MRDETEITSYNQVVGKTVTLSEYRSEIANQFYELTIQFTDGSSLAFDFEQRIEASHHYRKHKNDPLKTYSVKREKGRLAMGRTL